MMIRGLERDTSDIVTEIRMRAILSVEKLMAKVSTCGQTGKSTTGNGSMASRRAMACGKVFRETPILDSGKTLEPMVTEFISGPTAIAMKALGMNA